MTEANHDPSSAGIGSATRPDRSSQPRCSGANGTFFEVTPEKLEGKKIGVVVGSAHEQYLRTLFTEAELRLFHDTEGAREALRRGEVDLLFGDGYGLSFWLNGASSGGIVVAPVVSSSTSVFHSPQDSHFPCQRLYAEPQFWQTKERADLAMG